MIVSAPAESLESLLLGRVVPSPDGRVDVVVRGEVDWSNQHLFAALIDAAWDELPTRLVVDLRGVTFLGLSVLRVLVSARRRAGAEGASFEVLDVHQGALRVLRHLEDFR